MAVNFEVLTGLLIRFVTLRIRNGDCTERQLARLIGTSQPQLHNVLKGARPLKQGLADALLKHFQIGLFELLSESMDFGNEVHGEGRGNRRARGEPIRHMVLEPAASARKPVAFEQRRADFRRRAG
jgi:hypothetical protein